MDDSKKSLTAPISLTGVRAMFSIATLSRGRAPLAVCLAVFLLGFAALEIRAQEEARALLLVTMKPTLGKSSPLSCGRTYGKTWRSWKHGCERTSASCEGT